ncbi:nuclear transport factor 2 family protein [Frankia sp. CNm7]|uniref:Nuclear transport factor 2 family protein n=1 Tax=Frankia nepalensis TaxID=1836974 RepID=A0A937RCH7_9ACTN|nr:nuclear transport factor 2 family protein [Frankia nepalensis]MBL7496388.1 nuclear transport factor 2 family protein [Frankia nepalensis]MBL7511462.1 nuclear transport factor 2 family protein [Frankia nepalensis]MBL7523868.1 nuclear transport factor 2 family protein [Frankia nepalensis]MBL7627327.1 nuclear transport factor 2 family protein [Frankia nepalensis]
MTTDLTTEDLRRLRRVGDRDEIRQLAYRYAWGLDSRDTDAVAELWIPSAVEAMKRRFRRSMSEVGVTVLFVGNHLIDFDDDDEAHGLVYCRGYIETRDGPHPGRFVEQAILYRDSYRRVDGAWRFVSRGHELWFGVETAERPLGQRAARWPEHHDGVGTVPYDEPSWRAFWAECADPQYGGARDGGTGQGGSQHTRDGS